MSAKVAKIKASKQSPRKQSALAPVNPAPIPTTDTDCFHSIPWLDLQPSLQQWFADFLARFWERIYPANKLLMLDTTAWRALKDAVVELASRLGCLSTEQQLRELDRLANQYGLESTHERVVDELHYHLTRYGQRRENLEACLRRAERMASTQWCCVGHLKFCRLFSVQRNRLSGASARNASSIKFIARTLSTAFL